MEVLFKAITTRYNDASTESVALRASLSNGLHFYIAPQGTNMPYAVYFLVSNVPERTFQERFENSLIQFNIFSSREQSTDSAAEIVGLYDDLIAVFDECALTITGYTSLYMLREFSELLYPDDDEIFQYVTTYRILAEKD